jgi:transcriptional regulator with XRE-family HTH domain
MAGIFYTLEARRRALGMTHAVLAKKCGVSKPTVVRILAGRHRAPALNNVGAIAQALGMTLEATPQVAAEDLLREQAERKAASLVGLVQGTSGLEGQGVDQETLERMKRQTVHELLGGPRRRLW